MRGPRLALSAAAYYYSHYSLPPGVGGQDSQGLAAQSRGRRLGCQQNCLAALQWDLCALLCRRETRLGLLAKVGVPTSAGELRQGRNTHIFDRLPLRNTN